MRRIMTSIAIGTLILGGLTSLGLATAASAAGPTITATPNTGLQNESVVAVTGSGFADGETVYLVECPAVPTSSNCDEATAVPTTTSATGTISANFTVITGTISGTVTCGTSSSDLANCSIVAAALPPATDEALTPITFALPSPTTTTTTTTPPVKIGPRRFHVAPVKNLKNGSKVRVSGTGFKPGDQVYVIECLASSTSEAGCDLKTLHPVKINAKGVLGAFNFQVVTGKIGNGTCGTKASNLRSCSISVANASKGDSARTRIAFK
jgi:hypothetical protein